jgi:hypothetical protein
MTIAFMRPESPPKSDLSDFGYSVKRPNPDKSEFGCASVAGHPFIE